MEYRSYADVLHDFYIQVNDPFYNQIDRMPRGWINTFDSSGQYIHGVEIRKNEVNEFLIHVNNETYSKIYQGQARKTIRIPSNRKLTSIEEYLNSESDHATFVMCK